MKRVCSLCLSLVLAFVLTCPALAAVTATEPEIAAAYLKERGIMVGAENGNMMLDSGLTRTELAVLLARITVKPEYLEAEQKLYIRACRFTDVPNWAKVYVGFCSYNGLMAGYGGEVSHLGGWMHCGSAVPRLHRKRLGLFLCLQQTGEPWPGTVRVHNKAGVDSRRYGDPTLSGFA